MTDRSELPGFATIPEPDLMFAGGKRDKHPLRGLIAQVPREGNYATRLPPDRGSQVRS
jgi:hypothetical protein